MIKDNEKLILDNENYFIFKQRTPDDEHRHEQNHIAVYISRKRCLNIQNTCHHQSDTDDQPGNRACLEEGEIYQ